VPVDGLRDPLDLGRGVRGGGVGVDPERGRRVDYAWPVDGRKFPRLQIITIAELLDGKRPNMPTPFLPYVQAQRLVDDKQLTLGL
jgi:hypothetical protein